MREKEERESERRNRGDTQGASKGTQTERRDTVAAPSSSGGRHLDKVTTSFFVTNFPEEVTQGDLWKLFITYGRVGEVFIPRKLNKWNRKFAFVKFREVRWVEELEASLQDVWWGEKKLKINIARFGREEGGREEKNGTMNQGKSKFYEARNKVVAGKSFTEALQGGERVVTAVVKEAVSPVMEVEPSEEALEDLKYCFVGVLNHHMEA